MPFMRLPFSERTPLQNNYKFISYQIPSLRWFEVISCANSILAMQRVNLSRGAIF